MLLCCCAGRGRAQTGSSQEVNIDSLESVVKAAYAAQNTRAITPPVVNALVLLATEYDTREPQKALQYVRRAESEALRIGDSLGYANALNELGILYRFFDEYDTALAYHTKAYKLFERLKVKQGMGEVFNNIGGVYQSRANFGKAMDYYLQALGILETLDDTAWRARVMMNIGVVYRLEGNYVMALDYQQKALELRQRFGVGKRAVALSYYNIGGVYQAQGEYGRALEQYEIMRHLCEDVHDKHGVALAFGGIGATHQKLRHFDSALAYQAKAVTMFEELGDRRGATVLMNNIGLVYNALHRPQQALDIAKKALAIATVIGAAGEQKDACKLLSDAYDSLHNAPEALRYFRRYTHLNDSIFSQESAQTIAGLQTRYETDKKNIEIRVLQRESELKEFRAKNWRDMVISSFAVLAVILVLFANRFRLKQKSEEALRRHNEQIMAQRHELEAQAEEIKRSNAELYVANSMLEHKNDELGDLNIEKNEFLGIAAHDLKNPLTGIRMLAKIMNDEAEKLTTKDVREFSGDILNAAERMFTLIKNLLDVNAIERGGMKVTITPFNLGEIVARVVDNYQPRARAKNITLHFDAPETPVVAWADEYATTQVMDNLVSNAIKYSPSHTTVRVSVMSDQSYSINNMDGQGKPRLDAGSWSLIAVIDEGPGLSVDDQQKLFGKFARLSARPTAGEDSTGLGLSIVKKMVEAMKGHVWCESEFMRGATFVVALPSSFSTIPEDTTNGATTNENHEHG